MTTETLHGMLERLWHAGQRDSTENQKDCLKCHLQPIADQLQAVVERMPCTCHKFKRIRGQLRRVPPSGDCDHCQLQRILGTAGGGGQ